MIYRFNIFIFNPSFFGYSRITPFFIGINTINILLSIYSIQNKLLCFISENK